MMRTSAGTFLALSILTGHARGADPASEAKAGSNSETQRPMDTSSFFERLVGRWQGDYSLWMYPKKESQDSAATAEIRSVAGGKFLLFTYTWSRGEKKHAGVFLLGGDKDKASATWGDSFHMAPEPMICDGSLSQDGNKLVLNGHYGDGARKWGWRTELALKDPTTLVMQAFNIAPGGQEALAVRAEMKSKPSNR